MEWFVFFIGFILLLVSKTEENQRLDIPLQVWEVCT